ncbi:MAG: hypothetical protein ILP19_10365, partial [Oscillospiraceae bacterium]|nr:hypothetical protein [Oscillospiraceae bacterium]
MVGKTRKKKRKKYFRLKKNRSWFSVVMFSITSLVSAVAIIAFASIFLIFMVNSHIEKEYESKASLVKLYEDGVSSDGYTVFDSTGMDYFIKEDGNVIHSKGLITCSDIGAQYTLSYDDKSGESRDIYIYADSVNKIIVPDNDGDISVDAAKFIKKVGSAAQICFGKERPTHNISVIDLPVWISVEMNGGQDLVFKSVISIMSEDMTMVFAMMIMLLILFGAVLVTMIVNAAKSASDQHRINSLFFTDIRIKAHNWLWFVYYAEQKLGGKRDAKKKYAIADVEFVGFRRYCVCNTIDEGEILLKKIYDSLCGLIGKDELCAHDSDGKFALLLEYSDTKALKERMDQMLSVLSKTAGSKNLAFHAGIAPARNEGGKNETDIESDHANACAACATLEDKEGTGTAFYDEEIVKEQRWIETVSQLQQKAADNEEFVVYYQPKYDPRT